MTTMIGRILQRKEEEYRVAVPSLSDLAEPGLTEKPAAPVQVEEVQGETLPPPSIATAAADEAFLVIAPGTDPSLVFRFCKDTACCTLCSSIFLASSWALLLAADARLPRMMMKTAAARRRTIGFLKEPLVPVVVSVKETIARIIMALALAGYPTKGPLLGGLG